MASLGGNRLVTNVLIGALAALIFYVVFVQYYIDKRSDLVTQYTAKLKVLTDDQDILSQAAALRKFQKGAGASLNYDSTEVQTRLLHLSHDWEARTGIGDTSFARLSSAQEHGFTRLTFELSGAGPIGAVAGLVYLVETCPIPLRVDSASVRPSAGGDQLDVRLTVSALCRGIPTRAVAAPTGPVDEFGDHS